MGGSQLGADSAEGHIYTRFRGPGLVLSNIITSSTPHWRPPCHPILFKRRRTLPHCRAAARDCAQTLVHGIRRWIAPIPDGV